MLIGLGLAALVYVALAQRLIKSMFHLKLRPSSEVAFADLPTVSVCIPARNETHAMTSCLDRVLRNDYKKMEVIVYDDSSVDDTSLVIRSYAHAGVRFVPGTELPEGWIGKNHALNTLAEESSGKLILFMDVDTDIRPTTISQLVQFVVQNQLKMTSVIPRRQDGWRGSVLFSHLRYFWQVVLSSKSQPAAASALWLVERQKFDELGGIEAHRSLIAPESFFASKSGEDYRPLMSDQHLGVGFEKKWTSQCETSRRLLYPTLGSFLGGNWRAIALFLVLNIPLATVLAGIVMGDEVIIAASLVVLMIGVFMYGFYTLRAWSRGWWLGALFWPMILLQETVLFVSSLIGYKRGSITWKGRKLTDPVLRADYLEIDN